VKGSLYTIGYAGVLGTLCALLLTGVASFTAPYKANNARVEEVLSILTALGIPHTPDDSAARLLEIFDASVRETQRGDSTIYIYASPDDEESPQAVAMRFAGPGLWGPIEGFLALEADRRTIRGLTFSRQEETPGLGGEIGASWFRDQFVGKTIVDRAAEPGISIGGEKGPNAVDAITGATMTCDKLEAILDGVIGKFVEERHEEQ